MARAVYYQTKAEAPLVVPPSPPADWRPPAPDTFRPRQTPLVVRQTFASVPPPAVLESTYLVPILKSSIHPTAPWSHARDNRGSTYLVNGTDRPQIWDGLATATRNFGIDAPTAAATTALGSSGALTGDYYYYYSWLNNNTGVWSSPSPISSVVTATADRIDISNIPSSNADSQVTHWRLWRNTAGQTTAFYKVTDVTIGTTSYTDNITDAVITANVVMDDDNDPPPSTTPFICFHKDRMHVYGSRIESTGTVTVSNGSATVTGSGTYFKASHEGQRFVIPGDTRWYTVSAVASTTSMTLTENYAGAGGAGQSFKIFTDTYWSLWQWSKPGTVDGSPQYEYFPAANTAMIEESDGDDPTGLFVLGSVLYAAKRRHLYRLMYEDDPASGGVFEALSYRGLCNNRCVVAVGHDGFLLDEQGIYQFDGSDNIVPIDLPISRLIQPSTEASTERVNWAYKEKFHGVWDPKRDRVLFFVVIGTNTECKHAFVYERKKQRWSLEQYSQAITASGTMRDSNNRLRCWVADENGCVWGLGISGGTDGPPSSAGTIRGTATAGGATSLTDSGATFYTTGDGLAGVPVYIAEGTGSGQTRIISSNTGTVLTVSAAWSTNPDTTSVYRIGAIPFDVVSRWFAITDPQTKKRFERLRLFFQPQSSSFYLGVKLYYDFSSTVYTDWRPKSAAEGDGLYIPAAAATDGIVYVDMSQTLGYVEIPLNNKPANWVRVEYAMTDTARKPQILGWEPVGLPQPGTQRRGG